MKNPNNCLNHATLVSQVKQMLDGPFGRRKEGTINSNKIITERFADISALKKRV